ncbi:hypothetical protein UFOVP723_215 [uncultured Caudovirales phage]|uniref:Uncharacterized protein n=1 Tax=uncultured Caudovirales phage TaxID=2100421 RepID=A0A6J5NS41_9CAUD|nr:hypothetical protein UFOVP723_215 [uncultured Caudovirales phage]
MSQIFYSELDKNLQEELNARARAGVGDRSETALRYMTEKVANVSLTAYEGNKRDKTKIVHELGGKTVLTGEYLPGGDNGYLTERTYTLGESRWLVNEPGYGLSRDAAANIYQYNVDDITANESITAKTYTNKSYRIPPFITQASLQINDNSKGTTNKATINITIPNPDRDLNYMESVYARPGRYCMVRIEHPDSALMTLNNPDIQGKLLPSSLPARNLIKERYPEADTDYDELRKMNKIQFEGLITSFEYSYNQDGTISMTIYILGTSQTYTDLSMIMQTNATGSITGSNSETITPASTFYTEIYNEVKSRYDIKAAKSAGVPADQLTDPDWAFGIKSEGGGWFWNYQSISGKYSNSITLDYLIDFINRKILSKLNDVVNSPRINSSKYAGCYSNYYPFLVSSNPDNILLISNTADPELIESDSYGLLRGIDADDRKAPRKWIDFVESTEGSEWLDKDVNFGVPGNIYINLELINSISKKLTTANNEFTVGSFLKEISNEISSATGGAISMKLITDPEDLTVMYYRDVNWFKDASSPQPYLMPMFASSPNGTLVRDFKLSAKLPSSVQSLMYSINSTDKVTESQLGPYISFMYNNGTSTRTPQTVTTTDGNLITVDEMTAYGGGKELTEKLANEYKAAHEKYVLELLTARDTFGQDPRSETKRNAVKSALIKYLQYPFPTIQQTNQVAAPTFPIDAEFTIDGINGLRYGDIIDFPALPEKYRTNSTFTIKGINHSISTTGEWTTQVSCLMRPKFD